MADLRGLRKWCEHVILTPQCNPRGEASQCHFGPSQSRPRAAIRAQLEKLIRLNKTRAYFAETFEESIESYNTRSRNIEELFEELVKLSRNLSEEHICESYPERNSGVYSTAA